MNTTTITMDLRSFKTATERNESLEKELDISLEKIRNTIQDTEEHIHCENLIGAISLPLGVAGPIQVNGTHISGNFYIPLATTEGALVASVSRGCKAISNCGGAMVHTEHIGTTRGSLFEVVNIQEGASFRKWIEENESILATKAESTSSHLKLLKIESTQNGKNIYVRFYYDTQEAMGMNMVTIATDAICRFIEKEKGIRCVAVAGNYDIDKKPAWLNVISGRGRKGWAETIITKKIASEILKTTPEAIAEIVLKKCWAGSMMAGSLGFNAHFANITAAFFAATGQDLAHVVEGSIGITSAEVLENGDLYFSVYMPDIMLGTVGGGTKLVTQTEARSILHIQKAEELAEVFVSAILAGELSLIASIAANTLASAHQKLGR